MRRKEAIFNYNYKWLCHATPLRVKGTRHLPAFAGNMGQGSVKANNLLLLKDKAFMIFRSRKKFMRPAWLGK
jgi:hypothetical protein